MAHAPDNGAERPPRAGYIAAILVSALGHAGLFALVFFVAPFYLHSDDAPPPAYTVKIVDSLPAGDLGTHLPRLSQAHPQKQSKAEEPKPEEQNAPEPKLSPDDDKNAIALNTRPIASATATPTPTPTPEPTPEPTAAPPRPTPTPRPTRTPAHHRTPRSTPKSTPAPKAKSHPKAAPSVVVAKIEPTPSVKARLDKLKEQLLAEHLKEQAKHRANEESDDSHDTRAIPRVPGAPSGGGPVAASKASEGVGYGVGPGTGSAGIQQDPEFLLYYSTVQEQIKKAWNFSGGSPDLTATVDFAIGPDGSLAGVRIAQSSKDSAFDDSVIRAIRRAAPFPPPPDKYRSQFSQGIEALFKLGELKS